MNRQLKYILRCNLCGREYTLDPFRLYCDEEHEPSLLRAVYRQKKLEVKENLPGLFRFMDWLPVERYLDTKGKPITYLKQKSWSPFGIR